MNDDVLHFQIDDEQAVCGERVFRGEQPLYPSTEQLDEVTCPHCLAALAVTKLLRNQ